MHCSGETLNRFQSIWSELRVMMCFSSKFGGSAAKKITSCNSWCWLRKFAMSKWGNPAVAELVESSDAKTVTKIVHWSVMAHHRLWYWRGAGELFRCKQFPDNQTTILNLSLVVSWAIFRPTSQFYFVFSGDVRDLMPRLLVYAALFLLFLCFKTISFEILLKLKWV